MRNELKKAILSDNLFDYISEVGYQLDKSELIEIIKELDFTAYEMGKSEAPFTKDNYNKRVVGNLEEYSSIFEED